MEGRAEMAHSICTPNHTVYLQKYNISYAVAIVILSLCALYNYVLYGLYVMVIPTIQLIKYNCLLLTQSNGSSETIQTDMSVDGKEPGVHNPTAQLSVFLEQVQNYYVIGLCNTIQNEKLWQACKDGALNTVNEAFSKGADRNWRNPNSLVSIYIGHEMTFECIH